MFQRGGFSSVLKQARIRFLHQGNSYTDSFLTSILEECQVIAVVGASNKSHRISFKVMEVMQTRGYWAIPVNPNLPQDKLEVHGEPVFKDLRSISDQVDMVNIFRKSKEVYPIVQEAIEIGAKVVWMQQGVIDAKAAELAKAHGIRVVMDRCWMTEFNRLLTNKGQ